jgi:hypothetical protein
MSSQEPAFLADNQSVASLVTQLNKYFSNSYSHVKVERSSLISQLEAADGDQLAALQKQLQDLDEELALFGMLGDALSIADRLLHMRSVRAELAGTAAYTIHQPKHEANQ